ncbi:M48 family metalloprotease [Desulfonema magnum]|nr:M48 family metalloprotease [Desulfonema magnum]
MKTVFIFLITGIFLASFPETSPVFSQEQYRDYWVRNYDILTAKDHPRVSRTRAIFNRVLAAADKRSNRYPKLLIINETGYPWAISLQDGTVILTQKAMENCYINADRETGDARLAFIFGHEMAHLAKDDFWHVSAFKALQDFGTGRKADQENRSLLLKTEDIENTSRAREIARKKELQADAYGILYTSMAGFDPLAIVDANGLNFFQEWISQLTEKTAHTYQIHSAPEHQVHPTPEQRAAFLLVNMRAVVNEIYLFDLGVRFCQIGRYEKGLALLEAFKEKYPCREVCNNLGLIHYEIAVRALAACDPNKAYQFKLATVLDTDTRAGRLVAVRGRECPRMTQFKAHIQYAIHDFKTACEKESSYLAARVNISSALIMDGNYSGALAALDDALKISADDPGVLCNRAVAMYLLGNSVKTDIFEQASEILKSVSNSNKGFSDAFYNLGRLLAEQDRKTEAKEIWERFIQFEPAGIYADMVREFPGMEAQALVTGKITSSHFAESSPVILGGCDKITEKQLEGFVRHPLGFGLISGDCYIKNSTRVFVLDYVVELVETPVRQKISVSSLKSAYGRPRRIISNPSGVKTFVYENFAADVENGVVNKVIHF